MDYKWKIWYSTFTVIGSTQAEWESAPGDDVQAVVEYFGLDRWKRRLQSVHIGNDWYWFYNGQIYDSVGTHSNQNEWIEQSAPEGAIIKRGKYTTDDNMLRIQQEVNEFIATGVM